METTLNEMRLRHEKEIKLLRKNCNHDFQYDKFPNGETNIMRWKCSKCEDIMNRPFTINL